jgi:hypothetical protein
LWQLGLDPVNVQTIERGIGLRCASLGAAGRSSLAAKAGSKSTRSKMATAHRCNVSELRMAAFLFVRHDFREF